MFGQRDKRDKRDFTGFYGTTRKSSGRDIRDRDNAKKFRDGTFGIGTIQKFFGTGQTGSGQ